MTLQESLNCPECKTQLLQLIEEEKLKTLQQIADNHYDDMHKTYDFEGIAKEVLNRVNRKEDS